MWTIARNTLRWFWRHKLLYVFFVCGFLFAIISLVLGQLALDGGNKVTIDVFLFLMEALGMIFVLFLGSQLVYQEKKNKTLKLLLFKSSKSKFVGGKFLWFVIFLLVLLFVLFLFFVILFVSKSLGGTTMRWLSCLSVFFVYIKLVLLLSVVLFFAVAVSPLISVFAGLVVYILWHLLPFLKYYVWLGYTNVGGWTKVLVDVLYFVLPNLEQLSFKEYIFIPSIWDLYSLVVPIVVALLYIFLLLLASIAVYWWKAWR